jgi:hypothetical protein
VTDAGKISSDVILKVIFRICREDRGNEDLGQESNRVPLELKSDTLPLDQSVRFIQINSL